jgi:hypothetical protein
MFERGERDTCAVCGVELAAFEELPPSPDALVDDEGIPVAPEHEPLRRTDMRRGKGLLAALALAGLALFFLPWMVQTFPDEESYSGFYIARKLGWAWGPACAWVVLVPTVLSRQSIAQLRGARVIAAFLAAVPAVTAAILLLVPPRSAYFHLHPAWAIYATLGTSLVAFVGAVRLGGRIDDLKVSKGSSAGNTLH